MRGPSTTSHPLQPLPPMSTISQWAGEAGLEATSQLLPAGELLPDWWQWHCGATGMQQATMCVLRAWRQTGPISFSRSFYPTTCAPVVVALHYDCHLLRGTSPWLDLWSAMRTFTVATWLLSG